MLCCSIGCDNTFSLAKHIIYFDLVLSKDLFLAHFDAEQEVKYSLANVLYFFFNRVTQGKILMFDSEVWTGKGERPKCETVRDLCFGSAYRGIINYSVMMFIASTGIEQLESERNDLTRFKINEMLLYDSFAPIPGRRSQK